MSEPKPPATDDYPTPEDVKAAAEFIIACDHSVPYGRDDQGTGVAWAELVAAAAWRIRQERLLREHPQYPTFMVPRQHQT